MTAWDVPQPCRWRVWDERNRSKRKSRPAIYRWVWAAGGWPAKKRMRSRLEASKRWPTAMEDAKLSHLMIALLYSLSFKSGGACGRRELKVSLNAMYSR